ncbi:MAG TPA: response regulator [Polyangiaceae bacterium]|jgi:CheY-like chemotaxis protein|nr:response regulator [Polyangiaceae bacterium]
MAAGRLLVIDDSPTVRKLVELSFANSPWHVEFAASGGQALAAARRSPPDVILLDFVLPDMRGIDVCEALSKDSRTSRIPIVVMTGKGPEVAHAFRAFPAFQCAIGKPATSAVILEAIEAAFVKTPNKDLVRPGPTLQRREAAAKALYLTLREALAQIPAWMAELGVQAPAPYFAKKLLSPELMGRILSTLAPFTSEQTSAPSAGVATSLEQANASFQGSIKGWTVGGLITFLEASGRTGELQLNLSGETQLIYLRAGEVILVSTREPTRYLRGALPPQARLHSVSRELMDLAEREQRATGTPVFVTLSAQGAFAPALLTDVLRAIGRRLLLDVVDVTEAKFAFVDLPHLPAYVEAHGRHVSFARNTLSFGDDEERGPGSLSEQQRLLMRMREAATTALPNADDVYTRVPGFSGRVQAFEMTGAERRVLSLVDGISPAGQIAARSGLPFEEALATIARLGAVNLIHSRGATQAESPGSSRPLMILEPDADGFKTPLASLLEKRAVPVRLVDLSGESDVLAAVRREHPRAVILNAAIGGSLDTAKRVRESSELSEVLLVALIEPQMADRTSELLAAGFDTTLVKPIVYSDIERLLH